MMGLRWLGFDGFKRTKARWWFQTFAIFTPIPREMIQFDSIFFKWVAQPPARFLSDPFMEREFRFLGIPNFEGQTIHFETFLP